MDKSTGPSKSQRSATHYVIFLSIVAALGGLLFGYDTAVISGGIGFLRSHFLLNPAETGWAASSALVGCLAGAGVAGWFSDMAGRKKALLIAGFLFVISASWAALANSLTEFSMARILGGIGIGMASMLSPLYIAEIAPASSRGRLVSFNQFAIVVGIVVVYFVNYFIAKAQPEEWNIREGWRWMFGSGAIPAVLFFVLIFFIPESPRWLVKRRRSAEALKILTRMGSQDHAEDELRAIEDAVTREEDSTGQLFQSGMRVALLIGVVLAVLQQVTGINVFMYYAPEIFKQLGSGTNAALLQTIVIGAVNLAFTIVALKTIDKLGRKPLMIIGSTGMGISLTALGLAAYFHRTDVWVLLFILGYIASFALSMGPVVWVVLSEIFPTKIRGRAMSIATLTLWAANYLVSQTFPMMDENPWLVEKFNHGFPFGVYAIFCVLTIVFVKFFVPETKGKSLEEIERSWRKDS